MDKEQIIINGVDVSGCILLDEWKHCDSCNTLIKTIYPNATKCHVEQDLRCETYPNCYYKQLDRKTAECEELKKKNVILQNRNQQLDGATTEASRYRKALEEIAAEAMSIKLFNFGYDELGIEEEIVEYADNILDIISKVKEKE